LPPGNEAVWLQIQNPAYYERGFWYTKNNMANKVKKKRNKQYQGVDAAVTRPTITRLSAANRSKIGQWWFERKRILRPVLIGVAIAIGVIWLIIELIRITNQ
jgi:hypothetical protein